MVSKILYAILGVLGLLLLGLVLHQADMLYEVTYTFVTILGLVLTVFYLSTWGYWAIRAWRHGKLNFGGVTIAEFIIVPIMSLPTFASALLTIIYVGFPAMPAVRTSRLMFIITLLTVMVLRNLNWILRWRTKHRANEETEGALSPDMSG